MPASPVDALSQRFAHSAIAWLLIAAFMGVWLRWQQWGNPPVSFPFRFLTHAHSHLMFLGWVFNALLAVLTGVFLAERLHPWYGWVWWGLQAGVLGMAVSFPLQGYGPVSIAFSTAHMVLAGWVAVRLWLDAGARSAAARLALRWAVFFLFLSASGPFALGYVMANGLQDSIWYHLAVYFYLHFQYNGWMVFALLSAVLETSPLDGPPVRRSVRLLAAGCLAGFAISTLWTQPPWYLYGLAASGAALQVWGVAGLVRAGRRVGWRRLWRHDWSGRLAAMGLSAFMLKVVLQALALFPGVGARVFLNRNWLIAYFHLVFVGVITMTLAAFFIEKNWLPQRRSARAGWWLFTAGFIATETVLALPSAPAGALLTAALSMLGGLIWAAGNLLAPSAVESTEQHPPGK